MDLRQVPRDYGGQAQEQLTQLRPTPRLLFLNHTRGTSRNPSELHDQRLQLLEASCRTFAVPSPLRTCLPFASSAWPAGYSPASSQPRPLLHGDLSPWQISAQARGCSRPGTDRKLQTTRIMRRRLRSSLLGERPRWPRAPALQSGEVKDWKLGFGLGKLEISPKELTGGAGHRYEKEFDAVQDVFELQVRLNGLSWGAKRCSQNGAAQPEQCVCLRSCPFTVSHHRRVAGCATSQRLSHRRQDL